MSSMVVGEETPSLVSRKSLCVDVSAISHGDVPAVPAFPLVPGPTTLPPSYGQIYGLEFPSPDIPPGNLPFMATYNSACHLLQRWIGADPSTSQAIIMSGEGVLGLWAAINSSISRSITNRVFVIVHGVFSKALADMAEVIPNTLVHRLQGDLRGELPAIEVILAEMTEFAPCTVLVVHGDTPTGVLLPEEYLTAIGKTSRSLDAIFIVDAVATAGAIPLSFSEMDIDICLLGPQKVLGLAPSLAMLVINDRAWDRIESVGHVGYDSLQAWKNVGQRERLPYTANWSAILALKARLDQMLARGMSEGMQAKHIIARKYVEQRLEGMGLQLFIQSEKFRMATCTSVVIPSSLDLNLLLAQCYTKGLALGSTLVTEQQLFRVGHMGERQTDLKMLGEAMDILQEVVGVQAERS